jgi:hypothetical protein
MIEAQHITLRLLPQKWSMPTGSNRPESGPPTGTALGITEKERKTTGTELDHKAKLEQLILSKTDLSMWP